MKLKEQELKKILEDHKKYIKGYGGKVADLSGANLYGANLPGADLPGADLSRANLSEADLFRADLSGANLYGADLSRANLSRANLSRAYLYGANLPGANLYGANLSRADLSRANLSGANLSGANLSGADLYGADLSRADLSGANLSEADLFRANLSRANLSRADLSGAKNISFPIRCPEIGSFTAYKLASHKIVKLLIPASAKRSSATSEKCRASKAKVLGIYEKNGEKSKEIQVSSNYDTSFVYKIGKFIKVENFDDNRWNECAPGIHFFLTFGEAKNYE